MGNYNDRYERRIKKWLRSLTPQVRVLGWNPQLNQVNCL